ncbi:MAG: hypothetical protein ACLP9Y_02785 [Mycobacterium sp.]
MDAHVFGGFEGRNRRHGVASRLWTQTAVRLVVALLAASVVLVGGSATVHAGGPPGGDGGPGGAGGQGGANGVGPVSFFDQWIAHDSQLQLSQSGTGTLTIGDGALNTDQWSVTWQKNPSDSITITLATLIARSGPGMGNVGDQYIATIQPDPSGFQLLYMHPISAGQSRTFCTPAEMKAPNTPAVCRT